MKRNCIGICYLVLFLGCISSQQKSISVDLINTITSEETKYQNGKIVEVIKKNYGYSEINEQILHITIQKLKDKGFIVYSEKNDKADYNLKIDSLNLGIGICNSSFLTLTTSKNNKEITYMVKENRNSENLTDYVSTKIVDSVLDKIKDDAYKVILFDRIDENGKCQISEEGVALRPMENTKLKPLRNLSLGEEVLIVSMNTKSEKIEEEDVYWVKIETKDKLTGYIQSNVLKKNPATASTR
jgi:hypothetical protein